MSSAVRMVAELMVVAAVTAPKTKGQNYVVTGILEGPEVRRLAEAMAEYGEIIGAPKGWARDAQNVAASESVVLIGIRDAAPAQLQCGACGSDVCITINTHEGEFRGPQCAMRMADLGIAVGSAAKTASLLNVDNRVMYRIGVGARRAHLMEADVVLGLPLSVSGKSIYFDRPAV
ncbi:MAG: hypothetical protein GXY79_08035 [Chloroflexi bacterium]|nr:hypothetical protein [Chloroflexota bacterium]